MHGELSLHPCEDAFNLKGSSAMRSTTGWLDGPIVPNSAMRGVWEKLWWLQCQGLPNLILIPRFVSREDQRESLGAGGATWAPAASFYHTHSLFPPSLSIPPSLHPSIYPSIHPSIHPSTLPIQPSTCLSNWIFSFLPPVPPPEPCITHCLLVTRYFFSAILTYSPPREHVNHGPTTLERARRKA